MAGNRCVTVPSGCSSGIPNLSTRRAVRVCAARSDRVLPEHCAQGELVAVDAAGHSQPRPGAGKTADHLVAAERLGNGQRVGVEVEQAPTACNCRGQVAKIIEAKYATDGTHFRGQLDDPGAVGEGERSPIGIAADLFETGHGAHLEEPQQGNPVEGLPAAQAKLDDSQRPGAGTLRPAPHLARGRSEDVSDRVVELRTLWNPAARAASAKGIAVDSIRSRAVLARWARASATGLAPTAGRGVAEDGVR